MSGLHVATRGDGADVVLLHGWGFDGRVLAPLADRLAGRFRLHIVDLPGHGRSPGPLPDSLRALAKRLAEAVPAPAAWVGWSLGALAAWQVAADRPAAVTRLAAIAASPRFVRGTGWPDAVDPATLEAFARGFAAAPAATRARFAALVAHGDRWQREVHRLLAAQLEEGARPDAASLATGLALLASSDLRTATAAASTPTLCLLGEADALVPATVAGRLAADHPSWRIEIIAGAGHAPFSAHAARCATLLEAFLDG